MLALKYKDPSILLFFSLTYPTSLLFGNRIVALFNRLQFIKKAVRITISTKELPYQSPIQTKLHLKISR